MHRANSVAVFTTLVTLASLAGCSRGTHHIILNNIHTHTLAGRYIKRLVVKAIAMAHHEMSRAA